MTSNQQNKNTLTKSASPERALPALAMQRRIKAFALLTAVGGSALCFFYLGWTFLSASAVLVALTVATLVFKAARYQEKHLLSNSPAEDQATLELKDLKKQLSKARYLENIEEIYAERAYQQFENTQGRINRFRTLLLEKFNSEEITFARYQGTAEKVYFSILQNLKQASLLFYQLEVSQAKSQKLLLRQLEKKAVQSEAEKAEIETLKERLIMTDQMSHELERILSFNEKAITELDRVSVAIAALKTSKGGSPMDLETAMSELQELAERAKKYSL